MHLGEDPLIPLGEMELLYALKRRWLLATTVGIVCGALAAAAAWHYLPVKHSMRALVHLASRPPGVLTPVGSETSDFASYQRTQRVLLTSRPVLSAALRDLAAASPHLFTPDPGGVAWLEGALRIDVVAPEVFGVSMMGESPEQVGTVLDAVLRAYLQEVGHREDKRQQLRLEQLTALAADCKGKLSHKQALFDALAKRAGAGDLFNLSNKQRLVIDQLGATESELRQLESELPNQEAEAGRAQARAPELEERRFQTLLSEHTQKDRSLDQLSQQKYELLQVIEDAKRLLVPGKEGPFLQKYQHELDLVEERSRARTQELRSRVEREMGRTRGNPLALSAAQPQQRGGSFKERQDFLRGESGRLREEARRLNDFQLELESLRREINQLDIAHQKLAVEAEVARAESRAADRITLLEEPTPQPEKDAKRRLLFTGLGGLAGFGFGLLGVVWRDSRTRRLRTPEEVIHGLGMPVLGTLPRLSPRTPPPGVAAGNAVALQPSTLLEYTDAAWARLFYAARSQPFRVVMITSALAGEGKTFLTSQLAMALARNGRKILLLDCDLRRPSAHRHFNLPLEPGFREVLRGEASIDEAARPTLYRGLWLLAAGKPKTETDQVLGQEESIRIILENLKKRYDFILIDTSPVLLAADSLWLAQYVDAAIFSLLYDISDFASVQAAYRELSALGTRVLGAVFGRMPTRHTRYAYGRGPGSREG